MGSSGLCIGGNPEVVLRGPVELEDKGRVWGMEHSVHFSR